MSRETTEARSVARQAEMNWKLHKRDCPRRMSAQWKRMCSRGCYLRRVHLAAAAGLAKSRRLDKLPSPDQAPLF